MPDNYTQTYTHAVPKKVFKQRYWLHITLFLVTFVTTVFAGMEWTTGNLVGPYTLKDLSKGFPYAISVLFILGVHEFGHYFASMYHKVKATLPFFIPFPPIPGFFNFGTMGAVIKTKSPIMTNKAMFDIGVAGPISGFIACIIVLIYGFTHLPSIDYLLAIHPNYFSPDYNSSALGLKFGNTLLFQFLMNTFTSSKDFVPPMSEIYHYPYLCVGWFCLFVTAMNLIPVGQLDGGHIIYSMFGEKVHEIVASVSMLMLFLFGLTGLVSFYFHLHLNFGWMGWLLWSLILFFIIKIKHPPVAQFEKLSRGRMLVGYIAILIFILSFSPTPFMG